MKFQIIIITSGGRIGAFFSCSGYGMLHLKLLEIYFKYQELRNILDIFFKSKTTKHLDHYINHPISTYYYTKVTYLRSLFLRYAH